MELPRNPYEQEYAELATKRCYSTDYAEELDNLWREVLAFNKGAKAQDAKTKKRLVIAISENSHMGDKYLNVNPQWWQAFQKEVEDG